MSDPISDRPISARCTEFDALHWPVDVQRTDSSGEVDLGQLDYNLSLTPLQRLEQNDAWVAFIHLARRAGQNLYAEQSSS